MKSRKCLAFLVACTVSLTSCSGASGVQADAAAPAVETQIMGDSPTRRGDASPPDATGENACVANLPLSRGKSFCCLDEYLAHLEQGGAIDLPWWRQVSPGVYERVVHMRGAEREIASREELMRRFGFNC